MIDKSRRLAGLLLIVMPTVIYGGISILCLIIKDPAYIQNPLRQDLFRAGQAHAGVLLVLTLVAVRYVDEANIAEGWKTLVRFFIPSAAILLPAAFFFSVLKPDASQPNASIYLAYVGALILATGLFTLGVGLVRRQANS